MTYERVGQFLAQVNEIGINDMYKITLFPLSLSGTAFNWFVSMPAILFDTWERLEQKFHDYFYNRETELRLLHLVLVQQKNNEGVGDYKRRLWDIRNKCYGLTIDEKDLAEMAFAGLSPALKDRMDGLDFVDINQVLQRAMVCKNWAKDNKSYSQFKVVSTKEKLRVNCVDVAFSDEEESEVCVAEWVDAPRDKPLTCMFLRPSPGKKDRVKFTFDVTKCDKLYDVLLQNKIIHLSEGQIIPPPGQMAKEKYCKWHDIFCHTSNECNYFC
jgi:hypothetical protein